MAATAAARSTSSGVLERRAQRRCVDDTTPLLATIATFKVRPKDNVTEYVIRVQRGPAPEEAWQVTHRYSDFANLAAALQPAGIPLNLPPKKVFKASDRQFITERQQGLEQFLQTVLSEPILSNSIEVKHFLDPQEYALDFHERALTNVSMFFRSEPTWNVAGNEDQRLKGMGWRIRKQYYLISDKDKKLRPHLLTWCEPGPDASMGAKEMEACLKVLTDIHHPFILSPVLANYSATGVMMVREFVEAGSLRDAICSTRPKGNYLAKYGHPARVVQLAPPKIRQYGRQILEALNFLADKGFVMGHVHAGNILLQGDTCRLVDIENTLLGLPSIYRQYLVELKKLRSHIGETVYGFGHVLYEMCAGRPLKTAIMESDTCPRGFQPDAARIIEKILTSKAIKEGLPTLSELLKDPFFCEGYGAPASGEKPRLRVPSKLKEVLHSHLEKMEQRLLNDQKRLAQHRRLSKAQENVLSEDEKKKRRKLRKKQLSMQEEDSQEAYPTTTSLPRQNTISGDQPSRKPMTASNAATTNGTTSPSIASGSSHNSNSSNSKNVPSKTKTPPTSRAAPATTVPNGQETKPPPASDDRVALLGSIEGFAKGKLKKTVTNDRSGPFIK